MALSLADVVITKASASLGDWLQLPSDRHSRAEQGAKRRAQTLESMPLRRGGASGAEFWTLALYGDGHGMDPRVKPEDDEGMGLPANHKGPQAPADG
ncbi:hypothetical protein MPLSOD_10091 [Mesorhizobium sp. SOD10]|nr:hypothetical protein MPLSOD_10091 [Mesorhizobium sp. SOD10]